MSSSRPAIINRRDKKDCFIIDKLPIESRHINYNRNLNVTE